MRLDLTGRAVLAVAVVSALQSGLLFAIARDAARQARSTHDRARLAWLERAGALAACDARPESWGAGDTEVGQIFAVAPSGRVWNPEGPQSVELLAPPVGISRLVRAGGHALFVHDTGRSGRCRVFATVLPAARLRALARPGPRFLILLAGTVALSMALLLPLVRRVTAMEAATRRVIRNRFAGEIPKGKDALGRLGSAFNEAAALARAELAWRDRRDHRLQSLLEDLAHEVRTPLAGLKLGLGGMPDATGLRVLRGQVELLDAVFANLSLRTRLDADPAPARRRTELGALVEETALRMTPIAEDRGVELGFAVPEAPVWRRVDPVELERALANLIDNACRHAEGHVAVTLDASGCIRICDDGPGLGPDPEQWVARRAQGASAGRAGLGLSITREVIRRHGGTLRLFPGPHGRVEMCLPSE